MFKSRLVKKAMENWPPKIIIKDNNRFVEYKDIFTKKGSARILSYCDSIEILNQRIELKFEDKYIPIDPNKKELSKIAKMEYIVIYSNGKELSRIESRKKPSEIDILREAYLKILGK